MIYRHYIYRGVSKVIKRLMDKIYTSIFRIKLYFNGIQVGGGIKCRGSVPILDINVRDAKVTLLGNNTFNSFINVSWNSKSKLEVWEKAELVIGKNSGLNGAVICCSKSIHIGNNVFIGGGTRIFDTDFHNLDWQARRNPETANVANSKPVVIEDDVFIGTNCIIGKGITIGARSIVAAGSVVVKDVPPDTIVGGNPAKVIGYLKIKS